MSTAAAIGHGTSFGRGDGASPEVFTNIGEITGVSGPGLSRDTIDVTDVDSTDRWREFIGGLKDAGEVSLEINWDPNASPDVSNFLTDINANAARNYKLTFPDTTAWTFSALMTGLEVEDPHDDKMTASVTYKLVGKPAFIS